MQKRIAKEFPSITHARASVSQKEYSLAVDIYSDILEAAEKAYDQRSEEMCLIYLEYTHALISLCFAHNYDKLSKLSRKEKIDFFDCDEDLETAWSLLEICRLTFTEISNEKMLRKTHFLLGEILLNNDKMEEALCEYEKAGEDDETVYRKALCYEFMGQYARSIELLRGIKSQNAELMDEISLEIMTLENKKVEEPVEKKKDEVNNDEVISVNVKRK